jgi:hypothetical protein
LQSCIARRIVASSAISATFPAAKLVCISPIRAVTEARLLHHLHRERPPIACRDLVFLRPVRPVLCEPHEGGRICFRPGLPTGVCPKPSVDAILRDQAKQGILRRMQSFDWQIVYGTWVSSGLGIFLDAIT